MPKHWSQCGDLLRYPKEPVASLQPQGNNLTLTSVTGNSPEEQMSFTVSVFIVFEQSVVRTYFTEQSPFAVSPSLFVLQPGEATVVEVRMLCR